LIENVYPWVLNLVLYMRVVDVIFLEIRVTVAINITTLEAIWIILVTDCVEHDVIVEMLG
jgi:hypothetical protein